MRKVKIVRRRDVPAIQEVAMATGVHTLGEVRDFRRHPELSALLDQSSQLSMSWVALGPGETLAPHEHPVDSLVLVTRGTGSVQGDLCGDIGEGDAIVIPGGRRHGFTGGREGFFGLSIQFEARGLYTDEKNPLTTFVSEQGKGPSLSRLLMLNDRFRREFTQGRAFLMARSGRLDATRARRAFFEGLQVWSSAFQRLVKLRRALCEDPKFLPLCEQHLIEELGHDSLLSEDYSVGRVVDLSLEEASNWFLARLPELDEEERTLVVHLVLEAAASDFYTTMRPFLDPLGSSSHFSRHVALDEQHEKMGLELLEGLGAERYAALERLQAQAWAQIGLVLDLVARRAKAEGDA